MKLFTFDRCEPGKWKINDEGYVLRSNAGRFGVFSLTTPVQKEVTYSKGEAVRYARHRVYGIGYVNSKFRGFAFFDPHIRVPVVSCILLGVAYASDSFLSGFFWGGLFYLLIMFLSAADDAALLQKVKILLQQAGNH